MQHPDAHSRPHKSLSKSLAAAAFALATAASVVLSATAVAEPAPAPPPPPVVPVPPPPVDLNAPPGPPPPPVDPNAPLAPPPADPNAPPVAPPADPNAPPVAPPVDPNAPPIDPNAQAAPTPEPGRLENAAGGFSYVVPAGWKVSDQTQLSYGQALLTKLPPQGTEQAPTDTSVLLGRLDLKLFAGAEADNAKAATRLASDMGEFFMPFAGTRTNQDAGQLNAAGMPGAFSAYNVKFTDTTKPDGQIWAGVVGNPVSSGAPRGQRAPERWFVVWLGTGTSPIDKGAATALAQSIRPFTPPLPPPPMAPPPDQNAALPEPNAAPLDPNAPAPRPGVGVPVPVIDAPPEMTPAG
jgi:Fibronectin-attachment protein (FAP)